MREVYFFSNSPHARLLVDVLAAMHGEYRWRLFNPRTEAERAEVANAGHDPHLVVSFLNSYILPRSLLGGRAYNIHPASPDFPGRDPQHFAFYEGSAVAAATLHRMLPSVDSGEILDVLEKPIDRAAGVMSYIEATERLSIALLLKHLPSLLAGDIQPAGTWTWRASAKRTRKDFQAMCRLDPTITADELKRRIAAFSNPDFKNLYVELHGVKFFYDPKA